MGKPILQDKISLCWWG